MGSMTEILEVDKSFYLRGHHLPFRVKVNCSLVLSVFVVVNFNV